MLKSYLKLLFWYIVMTFALGFNRLFFKMARRMSVLFRYTAKKSAETFAELPIDLKVHIYNSLSPESKETFNKNFPTNK